MFGCVAAVAVGLAGVAHGQGSVVIVAEDGDASPGGGVVDFFNLNNTHTSISDFGSAVFTAERAPATDALFVGNGVTPLLEYSRDGDSLRTGAFVIDGFPSSPAPAVDNLGRVAAQLSADPPSNSNANLEAIVIADTGGAGLGVLAGDPTPTGNGDFALITRRETDLSATTGLAAFSARLDNTTGGSGVDDRGIYRYNHNTGGLTEIVRGGDAVAGGNGTIVNPVGSGQFGSPTINNAGQIAFIAGIDGTFNGDQGVFRGDGGTPVTIVRENDLLPGGGTMINTVASSAAINEIGNVAFQTSIAGTTSSNGVFYGDGTSLTEIVRSGDVFAGGGTVSTTNRLVAINDLNQVAFTGDFTNNNEYIARGDGNSTTLIAQSGDALPSGGGATFDFFGNLGFAINDNGDVAFSALFDTATTQNDHGIFFYSDAVRLLEVARVGAAFQNSVITGLTFEGTTAFDIVSQQQSGLNNLGQVAFGYQLADGTLGVAIWTVPEPAGVLLLLAGLPLIARRRRA